MFEFLCRRSFFPMYFFNSTSHMSLIANISLIHYIHVCNSSPFVLWDKRMLVWGNDALGSFGRPRSAEGWRGWRSLCRADMRMVIWQLSSHGAWNMWAPPSFLSIIALSALQSCRPESFIGGPLCICVCLHLTLPPTGPITLTPTADPNRADLGFSVSRRFVFIPSPSSLKPSCSSLVSNRSRLTVSARESYGWKSTCTCQVQWRWHLMPRAEIMKALTSQLKHIRLQHRGLSDTRSQHEWSEWVATLHFTCSKWCAL